MRFPLALSIWLTAAPALAAEPVPAGDAAPAAVLTKAPELLGFVEAPYPPEAEAAKLEGAVLLEVDLAETGEVTGVRVVEPAGHGFDEAATEAVRKFRFSPAELDGKPAAVTITYRYAFTFRPPPEPAPAPDAPPAAPEVTLRGQVVTRGTKKPIAGAAVDVADGAYTTFTDAEGRFALAGVPPGEHKVVIVVEGHDRYETLETVEAGKVTEARFYVRKLGGSPYEVVVRGEREKKEVARVTLSAEEIRTVPGTNGDTIRVVQNLPGVARAPFGFGVLLVRGGAPQDTRAYIDGQWVPLVFHFGGLRSVYASELVSDVKFYAGNFGARFGRAIGGAVEVETRDPQTDRWHFIGDASLIDALALAEGPVNEDLSVAAAVRRSYVDAVLVAVIPDTAGVSFLVAPRYWDYQLKSVYRLSEGERLIANFFGSEDKLGFVLEDPEQFDPEGRDSVENLTRFHRMMVGWEKRWPSSLTHKLEVGPSVDRLVANLGNDIGFDFSFMGAVVRDDWSYELSKELTLSAGLDLLVGSGSYETTFVQPPVQGQLYQPVGSANLVRETMPLDLFSPALWVEALWKPVPELKIVPGLRGDYDHILGESWTDVRLAGFYGVTTSTTVKAGAGLYHQPPQYVQVSEKLGNPDLLPEGAWQYMVGGEQALTENLSIDLQLYYKRLFHVATLSDEIVTRNGQPQPERWSSEGDGRSYGSELLVRFSGHDRFYGWLAYTLSRSERENNFTGEMSTFALDQPHNLTLVASWRIPEWDLQLGTRIRYSSGNPRTPWQTSVYDVDGDRYLPVPGAPFSERVPSFFQADVRVDRFFVQDEFRMAAYLDVQNVTYHDNVESQRPNYDFTQLADVSSLPIFPSLGFRVEY